MVAHVASPERPYAPSAGLLILRLAAGGFLLARCAGKDKYFAVNDAIFAAQPGIFYSPRETLSDIAAQRGRRNAVLPARPDVGEAPVGVLDSSVLDELAAMGMGEEFEREFIAHCLADADGCIGAMTHAAEAADWARLRDHAHAIKGVAANMGLVKVAEQGSELMRLADWQIRNEWRQRIAMLNAALTQGRDALAARQHVEREFVRRFRVHAEQQGARQTVGEQGHRIILVSTVDVKRNCRK